MITPYTVAFVDKSHLLPPEQQLFYIAGNETRTADVYRDSNAEEESLGVGLVFGMSFEDLVDLCFWVDIVLSFFTGFDRGFEEIMDKKKIAARTREFLETHRDTKGREEDLELRYFTDVYYTRTIG